MLYKQKIALLSSRESCSKRFSAEGFFIVLKPCPIRVAAVAQFMKYLRDFVWSTAENSNGLPVKKKKKRGVEVMAL